MNTHTHTRRSWRAAWAVSLGLLSLACEMVHGSGHVVKEERAVRGIDQVALETEGLLLLRQANEERLRIEGEDNIVRALRSELRHGRLLLRTRRNVLLKPTKPIIYRLSVRDLHGVEIAGSGSIVNEGLQTSHLAIDVHGSGDVDLDDIRIRDVAVQLDGAGQVELSGAAQRLDIDISGSGDVDASRLRAERCEVDVTGSGRARVFATDQLSVAIGGSGDVRYRGSPVVESHVRGSGRVRAD